MAEVKAVSRIEAIQNGDEVKPVSREEYFLKKSIGQGGSGGSGYTVETKAVAVVPEQSVTTTMGSTFAGALINLAEGITWDDIPDTLKITFQGQEYVCSNYSSDLGAKEYGAPLNDDTGELDWSVYPFAVTIERQRNILRTESAGTYTVKVDGEAKTVVPSEEFKEASNSSVRLVVELADTSFSTFEKIASAMVNGIAVYGSAKGSGITEYQILAPCVKWEVDSKTSTTYYAYFLTTNGTNVTITKVTYK